MKRLSLVLHTHMPYVEGFGTWPFGEEWLWEAMATSYLPLVAALDAHPDRVTLSLTPVLADQLRAPGASSWSHRTGVSDTVKGAPRSSSASSGTYDVAIASHSHSSPNGHVPNPST